MQPKTFVNRTARALSKSSWGEGGLKEVLDQAHESPSYMEDRFAFSSVRVRGPWIRDLGEGVLGIHLWYQKLM